MRWLSKCMKLKHLHRHELIILLSLLGLLSFIITKLPVCNNNLNGGGGINQRRSSRLDGSNANEDADDEEKDTFGAKNGDFSKDFNEALLKQLERDSTKLKSLQRVPYGPPYEEIDCLVNGEYTISARREGNETYIPFSFLEKYFEIDGKLMKSKDGRRVEKFDWHHSTARIYDQTAYRSDGTFMTFEHYHVEQRTKVKYISGEEGVPVSIQWNNKGYFYAIQIAQFGLTHYTKNLTDPAPDVFTYEDAESEGALRKWRRSTTSDADNNIKIVYDEDRASRVVEFKTTGAFSVTSKGFTLPLESQSEFVVSFDAIFYSNFSIIFSVEADKSNRDVKLIYTNSEDGIEKRGHTIIHGLGSISRWRHITRNLVMDYRKGITLNLRESLRKTKETITKVKSVSIIGNGRIDNITLWTHNHMAHFMDAANWLLRNQDENGGWPTDAERRLDDDMVPIPPGWYSAMAHGQAISTLTRAYIYTKHYKYLAGALRATTLYTIPSSKGGVLAKFLDVYPWYEEYPTTPSSFVLNGFIFSLIGLYDLKCIASAEEGRESARLYDEGINSLKHMIHLYDTGSGTIYDLRHLTLHKAPNLARWGYHSTHIAQLQLLSSIDTDPIFKTTLDRWIGYTKGVTGKGQKNKGFGYNKDNVRGQLKTSPFDVRVLELRMSAP